MIDKDMIMPEGLYNTLRKEWDEINQRRIPGGRRHNTYYKLRPGERKEKEKAALVKNLDLLKDRFVVDIGCNAGYLTYHTAKYARQWVGIERDIHWHAQAMATKKYIETPGEFLNCSIEEFGEKFVDKYDYDTVFGSCILYYLVPKELELMQTKILSKCSMVMLISREDKPPKTLWNQRDLGKYKNIQQFLVETGFEDIELLDKDTNWVTVIGRK